MRLIDAEQFVTEMEINIGNVYNPDIIKGMRFAIELINSRPTAFDKEKVRRELIELRNEEIYKPDSINKYTEARSQGRYSAFLDAIRIVEKGGIE